MRSVCGIGYTLKFTDLFRVFHVFRGSFLTQLKKTIHELAQDNVSLIELFGANPIFLKALVLYG